MCIVSYIPTGKSSFVLSSNRDESPQRLVSEISSIFNNGEEVIYPKETKGGSWIFASSAQQVICVLNGGFIKHKHNPPYAKSRGLIMKDFFGYKDAIAFFSEVDLYKIEPFTLVVFDLNRLYEFVWDGLLKHVKELNTQLKHVWSSSTLYSPEVQMQRQQWFDDWFEKNPELSLENIALLHKKGGEGDLKNGYVMNRNNIVCTVSITHIIKREFNIEMIYNDLIKGKTIKSEVKINQLLA